MKKLTYLIILCLFLTNWSMNMDTKTKKVCYEFDSEKLTQNLEIEFLDNGNVKGILDTYVHDEESGYETSSTMDFTGKVKGKIIDITGQIEIEDNIEEEKAQWTIDGDNIVLENKTVLEKISCQNE